MLECCIGTIHKFDPIMIIGNMLSNFSAKIGALEEEEPMDVAFSILFLKKK